MNAPVDRGDVEDDGRARATVGRPRMDRAREVQCPRVIVETRVDGEGRERRRRYARGKALGKGGFALVYAVEETMTGKEYACKVVAKSTLEKARARAKMRTEIRIHKSVACEHVVRFERCFEDDMHVYILMEKCSSRTLADVVKSRGGVGERAAACYMREAVAATAYLHSMRVIHRDLKLGNLFLTDEGLAEIKAEGGGPGTRESLGKRGAPKRLKIGDFGLACALENDGERRKTICGTPNYIAPEVLKGKEGDGHSYEVDMWSLGVILYTLLFGKPPFQTKDVKLTYKRIRANEYEIPDEPAISESTKALIRRALSPEPADRPSLKEFAEHPFMKLGDEDWRLVVEPPKSRPSDSRAAPMSSPMKSRKLKNRDDATSGSHASSAVARSPLQSLDPNAAIERVAARAAAAKVSKSVLDHDTGARDGNIARMLSEECGAEMGRLRLGEDLDNLHLRSAEQAESRGEAERMERFPPLWVESWVDYTSMYGVAYKLSDGTIGLLFNDDTKMSYMTSDRDSPIVYSAARDSNNSNPPVEDTIVDPDRAREMGRDFGRMIVNPADARRFGYDVAKKVILAENFREHLSGAPSKSVFRSAGGLPRVATTSETTRVFPPTVIDYVHTSRGVLWRLSNTTAQMNFADGRELLISYAERLVVFNDTRAGTRSVHDLHDISRANEPLCDALDHVRRAFSRRSDAAGSNAAAVRV